MTIELLTQDEVAAILRCSTSKVKLLRLSGRLPFIPGRPLMIRRGDLEAFIEAAVHRAPGPVSSPSTEQTSQKIDAAVARAMALKILLKPQRARRKI